MSTESTDQSITIPEGSSNAQSAEPLTPPAPVDASAHDRPPPAAPPSDESPGPVADAPAGVSPHANGAAETVHSGDGAGGDGSGDGAVDPSLPEGAQGSDGQQTGEAAHPGKRRRRRRKRGHGGADKPPADPASAASATPGAPAEPTDVETAPAPPLNKDKGKRGARSRPSNAPAREKPPFGVGEEVAGKVTKVMADAIMVDVAGKALGIFDRRELPDSELPAEGERLIAKVANDGARGGLVVLTRDLNRWQTARTVVEAAFASKEPVEGLITGVVKGGIEVDVSGLRGFAPASHVDLRLGADLHHLIGQRFPFEVVHFAKRGREFVLSRKGALEEAATAQRGELLKALVVGSIVRGTVRSVTQFGAFVDIGGMDGLVHMTEASHVQAPLASLFKVGDELDVKILRIDEKGKVWLSRKAAEREPWDGAEERYAKGSAHKGKVVRLQPFGAFIELEPGIDGLMHISDIYSVKRFHHPEEVMKVGEEIEVVVAQHDIPRRKIGLHPAPRVPLEGEVAAAPATPAAPRLALHQSVKCVVESQELTGLNVQIVGQTGRFAKGYIAAMATGTAKGTDLRRAFPVGKQLDAKIIELDPRRGAKLSIKALETDQERQSFRQYQTQVKQASKFGTFGDLLAKKGITK